MGMTMRQEYLRAAAEAYANLTELESDCYHYLHDGNKSFIKYYLNNLLSVILSGHLLMMHYDSYHLI